MRDRWSTARTPTKALGFVVTVMATSPPASTVFGDTLTDTWGRRGRGVTTSSCEVHLMFCVGCSGRWLVPMKPPISVQTPFCPSLLQCTLTVSSFNICSFLFGRRKVICTSLNTHYTLDNHRGKVVPTSLNTFFRMPCYPISYCMN